MKKNCSLTSSKKARPLYKRMLNMSVTPMGIRRIVRNSGLRLLRTSNQEAHVGIVATARMLLQFFSKPLKAEGNLRNKKSAYDCAEFKLLAGILEKNFI